MNEKIYVIRYYCIFIYYYIILNGPCYKIIIIIIYWIDLFIVYIYLLYIVFILSMVTIYLLLFTFYFTDFVLSL